MRTRDATRRYVTVSNPDHWAALGDALGRQTHDSPLSAGYHDHGDGLNEGQRCYITQLYEDDDDNDGLAEPALVVYRRGDDLVVRTELGQTVYVTTEDVEASDDE